MDSIQDPDRADFQDLWCFRPLFGIGGPAFPLRAPHKAPDLNAKQYDTSTYRGRVQHFAAATSMRTLFVPTEYARACQALVSAYEDGASVRTSQQELWHARIVTSAVFHPDTREPVFLPFRVAAFVPMNIILGLGLTNPRASLASSLFWQITNQTYNVSLNHFNRNASVEIDPFTVGKSYLGAVGVSCGLVLGLRAALKHATMFSPAVQGMLGRFVPWAAVASAGAANVMLMRSHEMNTGIQLYSQPMPGSNMLPADPDSAYPAGRPQAEELGLSKLAARSAVFKTATSRVALSTPVIGIPALALWACERLGVFQRWPRSFRPIQLCVVALSLQIALPVAIGVFPQTETLPVEAVEADFQGRTDSAGHSIRHVYFNRGL